MDFSVDHLFVAPAHFEQSRHFYEHSLGFSVDHEWGGDGDPRGVSLSIGTVRIVLAEQHPTQHDDAWAAGVSGTRATLHVKCSNLLELEQSLQARRARVVVPMQDTHWGVTWLVCADPDGNLIAFFQEGEASDS